MALVEHTPAPWALAVGMRGLGNVEVAGITVQGFSIANFGVGGHSNAAHTVKCVNVHDDLVSMLRLALAKISGCNTAPASDVIREQIQRVLDKVGA